MGRSISIAPAGVKARICLQVVAAAVLVLIVVLPTDSPFNEPVSAYTCNVYAYAPRDFGSYAYTDGTASCPSQHEYKTLSVCLIKQGVGVISCAYDSGYQSYYFAGSSGCYGSGYYR